ncbi:hypothetical protein B5X24_HaOG214921 [Helicoverpa armigera]|nr:hypothetical protein B5X24_HaOG214921 [Helicoverpa armigera]
MEYRIFFCFIIANLIATSLQCTQELDSQECRYILHCMDYLTDNFGWNYYRRNYHSMPGIDTAECPSYESINYAGYQMYPVHVVIQSAQHNLGSLPLTRRSGDELLHIIYSLDLSNNNYQHTPVLKSMENLAVLNMSRNHLKTAVLSNMNVLSKLREIDFSYNRISDIKVEAFTHPYNMLTKLNMSHNYLVKIPDAVFDKIDDLQTLDLSHNYIEGLSPFTFEGSRSLLHLNLSNNRLTDINSSLFRFSELKVLSLSGNRIKDLKESDFEKLNKLEVLDLSSNSIKTIGFNVFQNMVLLYSLDLSHNELEVANKDAFANLRSLSSINLSTNKLKSLPKDLFKNKTIKDFSVSENILEGSLSRGMFEGIDVATLDLSFQLLTAIEDYAFKGLVKLESLYLNNNDISSLSNMCFKTLTGMTLLDLSNNKIASIDFDKADLTYLQTLFLRNNQLVQIKHEHFQSLSSLAFLDVSQNAIAQLEPSSFVSLRSLISLRLSNNPLSGTLQTDTFNGLVSLPSLDISGNLLTTVQNASFNEMSELKELNMSHSKIKYLQYNVFAHTGYIETLDLSYNELEYFSVNMTDLVGLSALFLNNNLIKEISSTTLYGISGLTKLNLASNLIENIHNESFNSLIELRYLDLSYNEKLQFRSTLLEKMKSLDILKLSGIKTVVHFTQFDESTVTEVEIADAGLNNISALNLSAFTHMSTLGLRNNSISRIDIGAFAGISTLRYLDLSFNKISFIQPGAFKDNELLFSLNISHNYLSAISYGVFRGLIYLGTLDMSYNNIKDLQSERFYEVKSLTELIVDHNQINYVNAEEFSGLSKLSIGDNPLPCHILVILKKRGVPFEITAINIDEHSSENIDGITCNKDQERTIVNSTTTVSDVTEQNGVLLDIRNILYNMSQNTNVQDNNDHAIENLTNTIEKSNIIINENFVQLANLTSKVIDSNNNTNMLLKKILNSLKENTVTTVATTPSVLLGVNGSQNTDLIPYINKIRKELEKTIADEKQNIMNELEGKFSLIQYHTEAMPTSPNNEKLVSTTEASKSIFTETCVALILLILVGLVLYKFYKSRMFVRSRMSYSTRELPGAMDNSTL